MKYKSAMTRTFNKIEPITTDRLLTHSRRFKEMTHDILIATSQVELHFCVVIKHK